MKRFNFDRNNEIIWSFDYPSTQDIVAVICRKTGVH